MIRVLVVCAVGMSSSLLINHIKEAIKENDESIVIDSIPYTQIDLYKGEYDILLLGPQISHLYNCYKESLEPIGIPVILIPLVDYGRMDGRKIIRMALKMYEERLILEVHN